MNYIQFLIKVNDQDDSDVLVALLEETHFIGCEQKEEDLILFYEEGGADIKAVEEMLNAMKRPFSTSLLAQENWNKTWESNFEPVVVDNQIGIRAHFHESLSHLPYEIVITPKMSFGTGHHATTQLMLQFMLELDMLGKDVLDFGCGTGILAVFAKMKGAGRVIGTDNDPWCIDNSKENAGNNQCDVQFLLQDLTSIEGKFHLILANINLNILKENMRTMSGLLDTNGKILMSGILETDIDSLSEAIREEAMVVTGHKTLNGWACLLAQKV